MSRRLLVVSDTLVGGQGGAAVRHAEWFAARGWEVTVAAPVGEQGGRCVANHFPVAVPRSARDVGGMARLAATVRRVRRQTRPDVVHCHGARSFAATRVSGPAAVTLHLIAAVSDDPRGYATVRRQGVRLAARAAWGAFSALPDPPRGWRFTPHASDRLATLDRVEVRGSQPVFAWVGRLDEPKRPHVFVDALAGMPARGVMVGDGPLTVALRARVERSGAPVEMRGHADDPSEAMAEAWGVALFSSAEALTFVVQEAMWMGRPVVVSDLPGLRWLVGPDGRVARDAAQASTHFRALCDVGVARREGEAAAARIRTLVGPDDPWPVIEAAYEQRLRAGARRPGWGRGRRRSR